MKNLVLTFENKDFFYIYTTRYKLHLNNKTNMSTQCVQGRTTVERRHPVIRYIWGPKATEKCNVQFHTNRREESGIQDKTGKNNFYICT